MTSAQFDVSDQRSLDEIVNWRWVWEISRASVLPVTEQEEQVTVFMSLCKSKQISNCCHPNALMTLMEYLQDYASPETKKSDWS